VAIGTYEPMPEDEYERIKRERQLHTYQYGTHPDMIALLTAIDQADGPIKVWLVNGQRGRSLRSGVSNAARFRGMKLESFDGDGFVVFRKLHEQPLPKSASASRRRDLENAP